MIAATAQADGWTQVTARDGVTVWSRPMPGSPYQEIRAETVLDVSLDGALQAIVSSDLACAWAHDCVENTPLAGPMSDQVLYQVKAMPWPLRDRDMILRSRVRVAPDRKTATITVTGDPDYCETRSGAACASRTRAATGDRHVRVGSIDSTLRLVAVDATRTAVTLQVHLDPGGGIDPRLANLKLPSAPFKSLRNLRAFVRQPRFRDTRVVTDAEGRPAGFDQ